MAKRHKPPSKPQKAFEAIAVPGLLRKADELGAPWQPGKVSEVILDFAPPIMEADPGGPPDIDALRYLMMLVSICWNLPVLEGRESPELKAHMHLLDKLPRPIKALLDRLMGERRTKYGSIPFLVNVEVRGTSLDDAVIRADARMPQSSAMN